MLRIFAPELPPRTPARHARLGRCVHSAVRLAGFAWLALASLGCETAIMRTGIVLFYEEIPLPDSAIERDLGYVTPENGAVDDKQRLDLFLPGIPTKADASQTDKKPSQGGAPVLVFVHGGGWSSGDRQYAVGDADVYGNIGRYFASEGILTAVISYRLQPDATWRDQVDDVAAAVHWVRQNAAERGADPDLLFLSGHSAGSHLTMRLALDREWLSKANIPEHSLCGLIPVSGAAYDLADPRTYELGASRRYFEERFNDGDPNWERSGSVVPFARSDAPATLVIYGSGETPDLVHQSQRLAVALRAAGAPTEVLEVPGESHYRMALAISHPEKAAAPAIADFIRTRARECGASRYARSTEPG